MNGQLSRRSAALVAGVLALLLSVLGVASVATAHGGPIELDLGDDGAGHLMVSASYIDDGHIVEEIMDPVATAVSPTGEQLGPFGLVSGELGPTTWSTIEALPEGQWEVTIIVNTPAEATLTMPMEISYVPNGDTGEGAVDGPGSNAAISTLLYVGIGVGVLVLLALIALIIVRVRARKA